MKPRLDWINYPIERDPPPLPVRFFLGCNLGLDTHYYQFNIGDYQSHTSHLSEMEDLAYRRLLDWYYLHESPIPNDLNEVARQIRMRSHSDCITTVLLEYFEQTPTGWIHNRADMEIEKVGEKSTKASKSAKIRWEKVKDANALPTQSDSNATHNTLPITQDTEHKTQKKATVVATPEGVSDSVWQEFIAHRKSKKARVTQLVIDGIQEQAKIAGWSLEDALKETIVRNWQSFKADWVKDESLSKTGQMNQRVISGLTRGLIGGNSNVKLLGN